MGEVELFERLVSGVGFPIAACIFMGAVMWKAIPNLTQAVNNNSALLQRVLDKLDKMEDN